MAIDLILGTAGHIDHGKTALIRALTGVDTDRLPEEKRRGITIDLGFAALELGEYRLGIVDVPGHERFVRNMLAGATGMDLALLVVAANDSVKPQTREHFEILKLLNLRSGVIALTKIDLAAADWIELVEEEIRDLVRGSFLEQAPLVPVSAITGKGIANLREALAHAAALAAQPVDARRSGPFRMAIDRVFTLPGHGTVVTGSVASGRLCLGDEVAVEPGGLVGRVRGLQHHDRPTQEVHRGQRAALNLTGIHHQQLRRGHEVASRGHLVPSRLVTATVRLLPTAERPLKHRARVRIHVGTAELLASVQLLQGDRLMPGNAAIAQLAFAAPVVTVWGQPLVMRAESPVVTIGGGRILDPDAARLGRRDEEAFSKLGLLDTQDAAARAGAAIYLRGLRPWLPDDLVRLCGANTPAELCATLERTGELRRVILSRGRDALIHRLVLKKWCDLLENDLKRLHQAHPRQSLFENSLLHRDFASIPEDLFQALLEVMRQEGRIRTGPKSSGLADRGPSLTPGERLLYERLIETYRASGFQPPTVEEARRIAEKHRDSVPELLVLAAAEGHLARINKDLYLHATYEARLREIVGSALTNQGGLSVSQIKDLLGTSRKYGLPFCEYLDRIRFTRRQGDLRVRYEGT